jgi:hypothetical protein
MTRPHEPDEKTRKTVEAMSSYGIPHEDIALVIGIDDKTLRKYYRLELDTACAKANAQVASRLYNKCMKDDTASIIFWLKTRAQWKETIRNENEHTGKNGDPIKIDVNSVYNAIIPEDDKNA